MSCNPNIGSRRPGITTRAGAGLAEPAASGIGLMGHPGHDRFGAPGRKPTCEQRFREPLLYPLGYEGGGVEDIASRRLARTAALTTRATASSISRPPATSSPAAIHGRIGTSAPA